MSKKVNSVKTEGRKHEEDGKEDRDDIEEVNKQDYTMAASSFLHDEEDDDYFNHSSNQQELTAGLGLQYHDSTEDAKRRFMYAR